ncbi:MAG: SDR family NAD(P)-dependent oxidoreductase [Melioribacteraceae bacterium]|nr:SDR family NAD(P)-dependent oxidoreductase [Melioribacteraceae bacterium]
MSSKNWDATNVPMQQGKVAVVTGSSSGIGFETARVLASKNAKVIIAVRNIDKGSAALEKIKSEFPESNVEVRILDLADLKSIHSFAESFKKEYDSIDLLINNAGVMIPPYSKTKDGFELQFGTNHLGHFALTGLLLDLIKKRKNSRIVTVSSKAHNMGELHLDDLNWVKRDYKAWKAYGDSKIANLYFTYELQRKLEVAGLDTIAVAAHPGLTKSELDRYSTIVGYLNKFLAQSPQMGALPTLYAATANDVKGGEYFGPSDWSEWRGYPKLVTSKELSHNKEIAEKLWEVSEKLTKVKYNF